MKKIILSATLLLAVMFSLQAQDLKFGIKGGVNIATVRRNPDNMSNTGFVAGVVAEYKISDVFSIQPELLYSEQGGKFRTPGNVADTSFTTANTEKYNYLTLPILIKYYVKPGLSIEFGPQVGYLLSSKIKSHLAGTNDSDTKTDTNDIRPVDFGVAGGVAYDFNFGLFFQARYYTGIININEVGENAKNSLFQFTTGFKF
jgi:hypothetical protein